MAPSLKVADVVAALECTFGPAVEIGASVTWVCRAPESSVPGRGLHIWVPLYQAQGGVDVWLMPPEHATEPLPIAVRVEIPADLDDLVTYIRARCDPPDRSSA